MVCPNGCNASILTQTLSIERYAPDGTPVYAIPAAERHTCLRCGASWYDADALAALPKLPVTGASVVPTYDAADC